MNLNKLISDLNKEFGMNALRKADDLEECLFRIPTGSISLDIALGGGISGGRMTQISGGLSTFKSSLSYHILSNAQSMGKKKVIWEKYSTDKKPVYREIICPLTDEGAEPLTVAIIQSEAHSYTNEWAEANGIDTSRLIIVYPDSMEEGLNIAVKLQEQGVDVILHDSYASYKPKLVLDVESGDSYQMGVKPKLFDDYHGRYQALNNKKDREGQLPTTLIAINQLREKIGGYGNPEYTPGGRTVGFTICTEVRLRKGDSIAIGTGEDKFTIGQVIKFKIEKNKTYKPYGVGEFDIYFDDGGVVPKGSIDVAKDLIKQAIAYGIIERRGAWFYYNENQIAQGKDNAIELIRNDEKLFEEIKAKVLELAFKPDEEEKDDIVVEEVETSTKKKFKLK
jgi:recombination protein RecA